MIGGVFLRQAKDRVILIFKVTGSRRSAAEDGKRLLP